MNRFDTHNLLDLLNSKEQRASSYVNGELRAKRQKNIDSYYRKPYSNDDENWSTIVASDVNVTVSWVLPALLKTFTSTDKAVSFEPTKAEDVDGAEQATDCVNYIF